MEGLPKYSVKQVETYLASRGIPRQMVKQIRETLVYDAVTQGTDIKYDRIYTGIGLMLRKEFKFGPERIIRGMKSFDTIVGSIMDDPDLTWTKLMQELKDETGIVIRTGDEDDRLIVEISSN